MLKKRGSVSFGCFCAKFFLSCWFLVEGEYVFLCCNNIEEIRSVGLQETNNYSYGVKLPLNKATGNFWSNDLSFLLYACPK